MRRNAHKAGFRPVSVLRRFLPSQEAVLDDSSCESARLAHPEWILCALRGAWPAAIATANDEAPPMAIRVNPRRAGRDAYLVELRDAGIPASPAPHAEAGAGEPDGHHGAVVCNVDRTVSA